MLLNLDHTDDIYEIATIIGSLATILGMAAPPPKLPDEEAYMAKAK